MAPAKPAASLPGLWPGALHSAAAFSPDPLYKLKTGRQVVNPVLPADSGGVQPVASKVKQRSLQRDSLLKWVQFGTQARARLPFSEHRAAQSGGQLQACPWCPHCPAEPVKGPGKSTAGTGEAPDGKSPGRKPGHDDRLVQFTARLFRHPRMPGLQPVVKIRKGQQAATSTQGHPRPVLLLELRRGSALNGSPPPDQLSCRR